MKNTLIVILGPTGVGKTELSLQLAELFDCDIVSSDSRQIFKELKIGTAAPDSIQLDRVCHHFIGTKSITESYSAGQYEADAISLLSEIFKKNPIQILAGGSMLYIDALCEGLDSIPTISQEIRHELEAIYDSLGIHALQEKLKELDIEHYDKVDLNNKQRLINAIGVSLESGQPYSQFLTNEKKVRPFEIIKIGLNLPRETLYQRINARVDVMLEDGLLDEVKGLCSYKELNSLNTVGYKELFKYMDGEWTFDFAVNMIKQNSRRYAKRQLTWFNADESITWFQPNQISEISTFLKKRISL